MSDDFVTFECVFLEIHIHVLKYKSFIIIKCEYMSISTQMTLNWNDITSSWQVITEYRLLSTGVAYWPFENTTGWFCE